MKPLNVLVVEDDPINLELAVVILTSLGHHVTSAENGVAALVLCHERGLSFDLVLMDLIMPMMDGLEAIKHLRNHPRTQHVPILCVTAKASQADTSSGLEAGSDHYLLKPYKRHQLLEAVETTLANRAQVSRQASVCLPEG